MPSTIADHFNDYRSFTNIIKDSIITQLHILMMLVCPFPAKSHEGMFCTEEKKLVHNKD